MEGLLELFLKCRWQGAGEDVVDLDDEAECDEVLDDVRDILLLRNHNNQHDLAVQGSPKLHTCNKEAAESALQVDIVLRELEEPHDAQRLAQLRVDEEVHEEAADQANALLHKLWPLDVVIQVHFPKEERGK